MPKLVVRWSWEGRPIEVAERASVAFEPECFEDALRIRVDAPFHGDPPPGAPAGPTDRLWEHEVVELFLLGPGQRYTEIELGPHGHHLGLRLHGARRVLDRGWPIRFEAAIVGSRWTGEAWVPTSRLPAPVTHANAYAIHGVGAGRRYLAAFPVPGPEPDFHRLEAFGRLDLPIG